MRKGSGIRLGLLIAGLLLPVVLAGCSGDAKPAAAEVKPRVVAQGWKLQTLDDVGLALSLPPGWQAFNLDKQTLAATMSEVRKANPSLANVLSSQATALATQGIKFFAVDANSPTLAYGFATNVNVLRQSNEDLGDLDTAMTDAIAEIEKQFGASLDGPILRGKLKSGSGHAVGRLNYNLYMNAPTGDTLGLAIRQYVAAAGGDVYMITCTTLLDYRADYAQTFDTLAESLYFLE
jgi:hypothetical protein